jgi:hypothetical protein
MRDSITDAGGVSWAQYYVSSQSGPRTPSVKPVVKLLPIVSAVVTRRWLGRLVLLVHAVGDGH